MIIMLKNFCTLLAFVILIFIASFSKAFAIDKSDYQDATIRRLTDHLFQEKMIDFEVPEQFKEYVMIEDCDVFHSYFHNDFEWNRIRLAVKDEMQNLEPSSEKTKLRVPGKVNITRYNFTTQAFDIHEEDLFDDVGFLQISESRYNICDREYQESIIQNIPFRYFLKPEVPFNLFRVPVSKTIARQVLDKITPDKDDLRAVYLDINITLDAFFDVKREGRREVMAYVLGSIDSIDFYTDERRRSKFKTLYYDEY